VVPDLVLIAKVTEMHHAVRVEDGVGVPFTIDAVFSDVEFPYQVFLI